MFSCFKKNNKVYQFFTFKKRVIDKNRKFCPNKIICNYCGKEFYRWNYYGGQICFECFMKQGLKNEHTFY